MRKPRKDIRGHKFNKWKVLGLDEANTTQNTKWICQCDCGKVRSVDSTHLTKGKSKSCRTCSHWKPKGKIYSRIWARIKRRAKIYGISFELEEYGRKGLYDLLVTQHFKCAMTGLPISIANTIVGDMRGETTASLDRIDSSKGYCEGNVQWVHKEVNKMKWNLKESRFIELCCLVAAKNNTEFNWIKAETTNGDDTETG